MCDDLGHWVALEGVSINADTFGFIYLITNTITNKKYIGRKQRLTKQKRAPLKGKKRKRISIVETDWKSYMGSSTGLLDDITKLGKENFKFEIVRACDSKFELGYYETKMQFDNDVLLREDFYNGIINCRIGRNPKRTQDSKSI